MVLMNNLNVHDIRHLFLQPLQNTPRIITEGIGHLPHEQPVPTLKVTGKLLNATGTRVFSRAIFTTPSLKSIRVISPPSAFRTGRMLSRMLRSILSNDVLSSCGTSQGIQVTCADKTLQEHVVEYDNQLTPPSPTRRRKHTFNKLRMCRVR